MSKAKTVLATVATALTMATSQAQEGVTWTVWSTLDPYKPNTEMVKKQIVEDLQQSPTDVQWDSLIDWNSATKLYKETKWEWWQNIEPDPVPESLEWTNLESDQVSEEQWGWWPNIEPDTEWDKPLNNDNEPKEIIKKKPTFQVHGMVRVWTEFIPDFFDITSPDCAMIAVWDITNNETWLWLTLVRADNFSKDPSHPFSQATVINPHRGKDFWKAKVKVECKYNILDKAPEANWFTPDIVWTYTTDNWWTFEWVYTHKFQKWKDADAFRLWITKEINDKFDATLQLLYDSWYDKKFAQNLIINYKIGNWLWVQFGCVNKNWIHAQVWAVYQR